MLLNISLSCLLSNAIDYAKSKIRTFEMNIFAKSKLFSKILQHVNRGGAQSVLYML